MERFGWTPRQLADDVSILWRRRMNLLFSLQGQKRAADRRTAQRTAQTSPPPAARRGRI